MEEKDYALISDRELVDRLLIGDEEIVRYLFFDKCTPMFNYILHRFCPCQLDKNELINELYLYLQSDNWYKLRQFDFRSKLTTWLTVVAVRFFQKRKGVLMDYRNQSAPIKEEEKVFDFLPERDCAMVLLFPLLLSQKTIYIQFIILQPAYTGR